MLTSELTETKLKSQLVGELDKLNKEQLLAIHQMISRMIAEDLVDAVTEDWKSEKVDRSAVQKAIDAYRLLKPYSPPVS